MSSAAEASTLIRRAAEPYPAGDKIKAAIGRACRAVSDELKRAGFQPMDYGRAKRIWKQEARRVDPEELDAIRRAAREAASVEDARAEFQALLTRIVRCEEALRIQDADFFGVEIDARREALSALPGAMDRRLIP